MHFTPKNHNFGRFFCIYTEIEIYPIFSKNEEKPSKIMIFGVKCMEIGPNTLQLHGNPFRNTLDTHSGDYKSIGADFRIFTILGVFCRIAGGRGI